MERFKPEIEQHSIKVAGNYEVNEIPATTGGVVIINNGQEIYVCHSRGKGSCNRCPLSEDCPASVAF